MFSKEFLKERLNPLGFFVSRIEESKEETYQIFTATLIGFNANGDQVTQDIEFFLPTVDSKYGRIFEIEGSAGTRTRVVCSTAILDPTDVIGKELIVTPWQQIVFNALCDIISGSLYDLYFSGEKPEVITISQRIQNWFNTCRYIIDVDVSNEMKINSAIESVYISVPEQMMSHNNRIFQESWMNKLDPTSTPTSDKINLVYRLAKGAKIVNGRIIPSEKTFCSVIEDNAIASVLNPRRMYLARTTFENTTNLVDNEVPKIPGKSNQLQGIHLRTAVMHHGISTYEDALAISESAAKKFNTNVYKVLTFRSRDTITIKVKWGDFVNPRQVLAEAKDGTQFLADKIIQECMVDKIEEYEVMHHGYVHKAVRIKLYTVYPLTNGDKLSNRGACKGIVSIIPDDQMPKDLDGNPIDICVSPESIAGRRIMSLYWEMMAHAALEEGIEIDPDFNNPSPSFEELVDAGFGDSQQLILNNTYLQHMTFVGDIYWLRINKHAKEMVSFTSSKRVTNHQRVLIDDARISGQRIDISKSMALSDRGLTSILKDIIAQNPYGLEMVHNYVNCLTGNVGVAELA